MFFQGKEYKLIGRFKENIWSIISHKPVKVNSEVFFDYSKQDLIFFDKNCSTFYFIIFWRLRSLFDTITHRNAINIVTHYMKVFVFIFKILISLIM